MENFLALSRQLENTFNEFESELGSKKFEYFYPDVKSTGFGSFISFLRAECDNFEKDYDNREFYNSIENCFLKLRRALNE